MCGTLKSVSGNSIVVEDSDGNKRTVSVSKEATVTLDGKASKLSELKAGDGVEVSGDPATSVSATR